MDLNIWHEEKTHAIQDLMIELKNGELARDEYEELVNDILDVDQIYGKLQTEEDRIVIAQILAGLKEFAGLL